jgi:hypothetical protein
MTCEVAVMNKRGIALAADSAVTVGDGQKIYHTAEKLFSLSPLVPVGIMTFGAADMMGVPWETVIKIYAEELGSRRFDRLDQYAKDFFRFIEGATALFPPEDQQASITGVVHAVWSKLYREQLSNKLPAENAAAKLADIIRNDHALWEKYPNLTGAAPTYGPRIVNAYAKAIDQVETQVFDGINLSAPIRRDLRKTVAFMFGKEWFHPDDETGVVIAGMGDSEPFPTLLYYRVGTVAAGKLRYVQATEARIGSTSTAAVMPFAHRETIDMIINGIHPDLLKKVIADVDHRIPAARKTRHETSRSNRAKPDGIDSPNQDFQQYVRGEIEQRYDQPFMTAIAALPREDLGKMAEALVSLTAFLMRMSADQTETVAEPIDVAMLSKGDGFVWIKHKDFLNQVSCRRCRTSGPAR